jgi:hypothetical protein
MGRKHDRLRGFLLATVAALVATAATAAEDGFTPLFDGKTFQGWEGNLKAFRIEGGAIVGGNLKESLKRNEYLCTTKPYGDFELRLKFKLIGKEANSGVQLRSQRVPQSNEMTGYQADMGQVYWGSLYDHHAGRHRVAAGPTPAQQQKLIHAADWNDYRIVCRGRRVQFWLNGRQTVDYTEPDAALPQVGVIGLQIHDGPPSEAWYKDIVIRELPGK